MKNIDEKKYSTAKAIEAISNDHSKVFLGDSNTIIFWNEDEWRLSTKDKFIELNEVSLIMAFEALRDKHKQIFCLKKNKEGNIVVENYNTVDDKLIPMEMKIPIDSILDGKWYIGRTKKEKNKLQDIFLTTCRIK